MASDADGTGPSDESRPGRHRTRHNQYRPSHFRVPVDPRGSAGTGLQPARRLWLQERGVYVFGQGAWELLHHLDTAGSLSQAARDVGMSYARAWHMIAEIERGLGMAVVERRVGGAAGGGCRLNDEGKLVLERFEAFMRDADGALEALFVKYFGDLTLGGGGDDTSAGETTD